ncbi:MAG TPA: phosphotransferase [Thermomicrobiaceae bacterium]|nr:phosphotransferase [Thermomicrobiaceae bacterium]
MRDEMVAAVEAVVRRQHPDAEHVELMGVQRFAHGDTGEVHAVDLSWSIAGTLRVGQFVARPSDEAQPRLLGALAEAGLPVPEVVALPAETGGILVTTRLPGGDALDALRAAGMRWELSALAFTFARALGRIHALDWQVVAPWLADPEDTPEDLVDRQFDTRWEAWETRLAALPPGTGDAFNRALHWLDARRPVEVSLCLCHGDYGLTNVLIADDEVAGVIDWEDARVDDASYDLALLPTELAQLNLPTGDAELFAQATYGAYLQASPRTLGNLPFYAAARLFERALDATEAAAAIAGGQPVGPRARRQAERLPETLVELARALAGDERVPWRA